MMLQQLVLLTAAFYLLPGTGCLDLKLKGERVYIQQEVETILVRNDLTNPKISVDNLNQQINAALLDLILAGAVQKDQGSSKVRQILAKWLQITQTGLERLDNLFTHDSKSKGNLDEREIEQREKRAFEFLGDLMSGLTGVPTADMHREVLEKLDLLKLDNEEARTIMARSTKLTKDILHKLHFHERTFKQFHTKLQLVETATINMKKNIDLILSLIAFQQTTSAEMYKLEDVVHSMNNILLNGKMNLLSEYAIDAKSLASLIDNIEIKNTELAPALSSADSAEFYRLPITHSWANKETYTIYSLIQIPMVDFNDPQEVMILPTALTLHPEMDIILIDRIRNVYRFLSDSEYKDCLRIRQVSICQKRFVEIFPDSNCDLHAANRLDCNRWDKLVVHDLHNTEILLHFRDGPQEAQLECRDEKAMTVKLPSSGILKLGSNCALRNDQFRIHELPYSRFVTHDSNTFEISNPKWMKLESYASVTHDELVKAENKTDMAMSRITDIDNGIASRDESIDKEFDELFKFNNQTKFMIDRLDNSSKSTWNKIEAKSRTTFEKYTTWAIIGTNILLTIMLLGCLSLQSKRQSNLSLTLSTKETAGENNQDRLHALEDRVTSLEAWTELREHAKKTTEQ